MLRGQAGKSLSPATGNATLICRACRVVRRLPLSPNRREPNRLRVSVGEGSGPRLAVAESLKDAVRPTTANATAKRWDRVRVEFYRGALAPAAAGGVVGVYVGRQSRPHFAVTHDTQPWSCVLTQAAWSRSGPASVSASRPLCTSAPT
jgi:hypothetical protein